MKQPSLQLGLRQQLCMNPQLQQAIRLLQLSGPALDVEIQTILESNPLLEYENAGSELAFDTEKDMETHHSESHNKDLENFQASEQSLQQHLLWQLELTPFTQDERLIANVIVDVISEDGYCTCTLEELCDTLKFQESLHVSVDEIEKVLYKIQQFDPLGVGARNLSECLSLQINALPESTPYLTSIKELALHHLDSLGKRDYLFLKLALNLNDMQLKNVIQKITQLNPNPGRQISFSKKSDYIISDLIVVKKKNVFVVELNKKAMPKLRINSEYLHLMKTGKNFKRKWDKRDLNFTKDTPELTPEGEKRENSNQRFQNYLKEAQWFLKSLNNRFSTLLKVGNCIVQEQQTFLEKGEEHMQGLLLQTVAEKTNLHKSTVSRITTQKYIDTPRGMFELKYFFSKPLSTPLGNTFSTTAIRAMVKKLIQNEPSKNPYSDEKLKNLLAEQGICVSRRTLAKYRDSMSIPSSQERRLLKTTVKIKDPFLRNESTT